MSESLDLNGLKYYTEKIISTNSNKISTLETELRTLISSAQSTANSAKSTASSAYSLASSTSSSVASKANIYCGSYVGTGLIGEANPNSLTFSFVPKMIIIPVVDVGTRFEQISTYTQPSYILLTDTLTTSYVQSAGLGANMSNRSYNYYGKCSSDRKTIYWYGDGLTSTYAYNQFNSAGKTYYYIAIG